MKTKLVLPWKVKVGQKIKVYGFGNIPTFREIKEISKEKCVLCPGYKWRFIFNDGFNTSFYGKTRDLPPQKVKVLVE